MNSACFSLALLAALATMQLSACADASRPPMESQADVSESDGVRTVINYAPLWSSGGGWRVSDEPTLRIGVLDGPEEYLFNRIRGVTRLSTGEIVVLNAGGEQLRYYNAGGQHLRSVSRLGDGPGEMRGARWLERLEDDVVQVIHSGGRLRFGADGSLVSDDRLDWSRIHAISVRALPNSGGFLQEACSLPTPMFVGERILLCASTNSDVRFLPEEFGIHPSVSLVAIGVWELETVDTIGIFLGRQLLMVPASWAGRALGLPISLEPPYGTRGYMNVSGAPARLLYTASDSYRIERYGLEVPAKRLVIERTGGLRPPTDLEFDSFDLEVERLRRVGISVRNLDSYRGEVTLADSISNIKGAAVVDALNALWAPLYQPDGAFDVFDDSGIYLGQVMGPSGSFKIHEIGVDYVLGVLTGEFQEEYVLMFELDRSRAGF